MYVFFKQKTKTKKNTINKQLLLKTKKEKSRQQGQQRNKKNC